MGCMAEESLGVAWEELSPQVDVPHENGLSWPSGIGTFLQISHTEGISLRSPRCLFTHRGQGQNCRRRRE